MHTWLLITSWLLAGPILMGLWIALLICRFLWDRCRFVVVNWRIDNPNDLKALALATDVGSGLCHK
jgi:hypothetical protein